MSKFHSECVCVCARLSLSQCRRGPYLWGPYLHVNVYALCVGVGITSVARHL